MTTRLASAVAAAAFVTLAAPPAVPALQPDPGRVTSFEANFSTDRPNAATGVLLRTTGRPPEPPATLPAAVRQTIAFPRGTRLRLAALPQCDATDEVLDEQGAEAACPSDSRVGTGRAEGELRGVTVGFDLAVYAVRGRLFFAAEREGVPLRRGFFGVASGRRLALTVPTMSGTIAPTLFQARMGTRPGGATWLRTPRRCPRGGRWLSRATFQGLGAPDGRRVGPAVALRDRTPCRPRGA